MNAKDLIESLGGPSAVAAKVGGAPSRVSNWIYRGIPWAERHRLAELAREQEIDLPENFFTQPSWGSSPEAS